MDNNLKKLLEEQLSLSNKINESIKNSLDIDLDLVETSNTTMKTQLNSIELNIKRIDVLLNGNTLTGAQRRNLTSCKKELQDLNKKTQTLIMKSNNFIKAAEILEPTAQKAPGTSKAIKETASIIEEHLQKSTAPIKAVNKKLTEKQGESRLTGHKQPVIKNTEKCTSQKENIQQLKIPKPPKQKSELALKIEANLGLYLMIAIGTLLCLFGVAIFGKHLYVNVLGNMGKGIVMYLISLLVLLTGQVFIKKVKNIEFIKESITGLGLSLLYLSTLVNFLVLNNFNYLLTHILLLGISIYALYLSRKTKFDVIRLLSIIGVFIALVPVEEPTFISSLYIVIIGYIFIGFNLMIPFKTKKYSEVLNVLVIIIFSVLVNVYTPLLSINILNSTISIGFSIYLCKRNKEHIAGVYMTSIMSNLVILGCITNDSDLLGFLNVIAVIVYLPILNTIDNQKYRNTVKLIVLSLSSLFLTLNISSPILLITSVNIICMANIYFDKLANFIYEHKFEYGILSVLNFTLISTYSVGSEYLVIGVIPSLFILTKTNCKGYRYSVLFFLTQIISFGLFTEVFSKSTIPPDFIVILYFVLIIALNRLLLDDKKERYYGVMTFFIFSSLMFRSLLISSIIFAIYYIISFYKFKDNKLNLYLVVGLAIKSISLFNLTLNNMLTLFVFIIAITIALIYIYKRNITEFKEITMMAFLGIFAILGYKLENSYLLENGHPYLIMLGIVLFIFIGFKKHEKTLLDALTVILTFIFTMNYYDSNIYIAFGSMLILFILTISFNWVSFNLFNKVYYLSVTLIVGVTGIFGTDILLNSFILINILINTSYISKHIKKYISSGNKAFNKFAILGTLSFGIFNYNIYVLSALTVYYLVIAIIENNKDNSPTLINAGILNLIVILIDTPAYIVPMVLLIFNISFIIKYKESRFIFNLLLLATIIKTINLENPFLFIISVLIIITSKYINNSKEFLKYELTEYKNIGKVKITELTLLSILIILFRVLFYLYLYTNPVLIYLYCIISSSIIIATGFYINSSGFRKLGLGLALITCASILIFIMEMTTLQKTLVCCGVGVVCILIAVGYSKLEKKYKK